MLNGGTKGSVAGSRVPEKVGGGGVEVTAFGYFEIFDPTVPKHLVQTLSCLPSDNENNGQPT